MKMIALFFVPFLWWTNTQAQIASKFTSESAGRAVAVQTDCGKRDGWNFCVHRYPGKNPDILYYVHGYTDSSKGWTTNSRDEHTERMTQLQNLLGENSPTVVLISYSNKFLDSWLLSVSSRRQKGPLNATLDHFTSTAMPEIEKTFSLSGKRILYGMSMGGFNAAQLCLHHPDLWSRCLFQQPLLIECNPYAIPTDYRCLGGFMVKANFNESEWKENDPFPFATTTEASKLPNIFISGAKKDGFLLFNSNYAFAINLKNRGAHVEWHEYDGDHLYFDPSLVYEFISRK